jgi:PhnB protein
MAKAKKTMKAKKKPKALKKTLRAKPKKVAKKSKALKKNVRAKSKKVTKKSVVKRKAKAKKVLAIPKGYSSITAYLIVDGGAAAIEFYKKAFSAKEVMRLDQPGGKVGHAELKIGDAKIMLADECEEMGAFSPKTVGGVGMIMHFYSKNADKAVDQAVAAGAKLLRPVQTMFYGDRSGMVEDPYGHKWCIATHVEDLTMAQIKKRAAAMFAEE